MIVRGNIGGRIRSVALIGTVITLVGIILVTAGLSLKAAGLLLIRVLALLRIGVSLLLVRLIKAGRLRGRFIFCKRRSALGLLIGRGLRCRLSWIGSFFFFQILE